MTSNSLLLFLILTITTMAFSCETQPEISSINPINWEKRAVRLNPGDSLETGKAYLSIYSQIYSQTEHRTHGLTATISMRNTSELDSIFVLKANYYNTDGALIRTYFDHPIYLAPMETVEIVIDELDLEGGTGANFIFDWKMKPSTPEPIFEGVMISTSGQQGLSFTTEGKRIQ